MIVQETSGALQRREVDSHGSEVAGCKAASAISILDEISNDPIPCIPELDLNVASQLETVPVDKSHLSGVRCYELTFIQHPARP